MVSVLIALLPAAIMAGQAPPSELISIGKQETFASLGQQEASLMKMASQVTATFSTSSFEQLQAISSSLETMVSKNISKELTERFLVHMFMEMDKLQGTIPERLKIDQAHLDKLLGEFDKCDADRLTLLSHAERHKADLPKRAESHKTCRQEEALQKETLDTCWEEVGELGKFLSEDKTCTQWPAMKALKPVDHTSCSKLHQSETYEEYLERVRNELDSQLMLFREMKNACAERDDNNSSNACHSEKIAHEQKMSVCSVYQTNLEKLSCDYAQEVRLAWNSYSTCFDQNMRTYTAEVAKAKQAAKDQQKQFHETVKIRCMLGGMGDTKKAALDCPDSVPDSLKLKVKCPFYEMPPYGDNLPDHTGKDGFRAESYDDIPSKAPVHNSIQCKIPPVIASQMEHSKANAELGCTA